MRVAIIADMEGVSMLTDPWAILAFSRSYWHTGRAQMTADVAAAARGLLRAGADDVVVVDGHGSGNDGNNLIAELLPDGARIEAAPASTLLENGAEAVLFVGWHARAGVPGFLSHTHVPRLRLRVNGELIGESHTTAWNVGLPLLGTVGNDANRRTLGDAFAGQPYLEVQHTASGSEVEPVFENAEAAGRAIEAFAGEALRSGGIEVRPPSAFLLEASLPASETGAQALREAGWEQHSRTEFAVKTQSYAAARPFIGAAAAAAFETWAPSFSTYRV